MHTPNCIPAKQARFAECLTDMNTILRANNQHFFLTEGTLLGQHRENKFIDYDEDIDLGVLQSNFDPTIIDKIAHTPKFKKYRTYGQINNSFEQRFIHTNGTLIDIFLYYPMGEKDYYYFASFGFICNTKPGGFCKWARHLKGFKQVNFIGQTFDVPANTDNYLCESYGIDWHTPKKFSYIDGLNGEYKNLVN